MTENGPKTAPNSLNEPEEGEIVPVEGISGTHLDPETVQQLVERHGTLGPADQLARRAR